MTAVGQRYPSTTSTSRASVDEAALLGRALLGHIEAIEALVVHLMPTIRCNVARTLLASASRDRQQDVAQEVDDLAQDVLIALFERDARVLRAWKSVDGASLRSFVASISRRKTGATLRVKKRNPYELVPTTSRDLDRVQSQDSVEDRLAAKQLHERALQTVLDAQSAKGRQIATWVLVDDHDPKALAELAGISPSAAYQWRSRLKRQLGEHVQRLLDQCDPENIP